MRPTTTYPADVKADIKAIKQYLIDTHGEITPAWHTTLRLISDTLHLYRQCRDSIDTNGIYNPTTGRKNPLLATCKDLTTTLTKLLTCLGCTPEAQGRIRVPDDGESTQDFIGNLLKG